MTISAISSAWSVGTMTVSCMRDSVLNGFHSEDNLENRVCRGKCRANGRISEYAMGADDSEEVNVEKLFDKDVWFREQQITYY